MWQSLKNHIHYLQAIAANIYYGFPSRKLTIIGVTGTDGKTTTSSLIYHVLKESGYKVALISSVSAIINGKSSDIGFHVTTPRFFALRSYLKEAKRKGATHVVLEVTSHALDQHRVAAMHFDFGVVTNINKEHLDYHKTWERYVHAKAKLLKMAKIVILNKDDRSYTRLKKYELKNNDKEIITYGFKEDSDINPHIFSFKTKLLGRFNEYNCLAAIAVLQRLNIPDEKIRSGIATFKSPVGRQEVVYDRTFTVINDFAHTPQAFSALLPEIKKLSKHRLIHVFGCAAKRDMYKRPEMGKLSAEYADIIILTSEDPRNEPLEKINSEIKKGITAKFTMLDYQEVKNKAVSLKEKTKYLIEIPDRKEAIAFAISLAKKGDVVLLTGKGSEKSINYGRGEEPWDETGIALAAIREK